MVDRLKQAARTLGRAVEILRFEGLSSPWFKALARVGYRRVHLLARRLDKAVPAIEARRPVTMRRLGEADIADYLGYRPEATEAGVRRLLAAGYGFAAYAEGGIVNAAWAVTGRARIEFLGRELELAPDECYMSGSFTRRDFRGHNIAAARSVHMFEYMRLLGYRRVLAVGFPENRQAYRALMKAGYRPVATIGYVKLGPWRRDFYRAHEPDGSS